MSDDDYIIEINQNNSSSPVNHSITIDVAQDCTAKVKLSGVNINSTNAAVSITGSGDTVIELAGTNTLQSGNFHAGIEKNDNESSGSLEIRGPGSLTVTGHNMA
ncbi:MAG: carbohydrate-binding domain-containing protein, partial [Lachnospiraceae bacterium]|nr:carbohydrate-binding domain-containing protein [Lachnospiraceae bacterium]